jgi:hypothetical protein
MHYAMKTCVGMEVSSTILDLATRYGEWLASRPGRFTPWAKIPRYLLDRLSGPQSRYLSGGSKGNTTHRITGVPTKIRTDCLMNASLGLYC